MSSVIHNKKSKPFEETIGKIPKPSTPNESKATVRQSQMTGLCRFKCLSYNIGGELSGKTHRNIVQSTPALAGEVSTLGV